MQKVNSWCNIAGFLCLKSDNNAGFLALNVVQQNHLYSNKFENCVGGLQRSEGSGTMD